jgi:hypothetical protein
MADPSPLGHIVEGVVERDPVTGRFQIMTVENGRAKTTDVAELLASYEGQEVRLTLASFENLTKLAQMVEGAGGGLVQGVMADDLPGVSFNISRRQS